LQPISCGVSERKEATPPGKRKFSAGVPTAG
jgi:hypothetical protein